MYESLFPFEDDDDEVHRRLIYWLEAFWTTNQDKIDNLGRYFLGASIALILQLVFGRGRSLIAFLSDADHKTLPAAATPATAT